MHNSETYFYNPVSNKEASVNVWMAFPGPESFAMSSLGYLWLFKNIDEIQDVNVERIYSDSKTTTLKKEDIDLIGFSFTFDTDFINIFSMLDKYKIPLRSNNRGCDLPFIFAGGPVVTANPTPYEAFFDFFVIGDGEKLNLDIINLYKDNTDISKEEFLNKLAKLDGIYVPNISKTVKKNTEKLSDCIYTPIISEKAFFPNTFIMEAARGCANRCGFCIASYLNLPLRCIPYEKILEVIDLGLSKTNKIALLGAQLSAHPKFNDICKYILEKIQNGMEIEMSVSSLRVDSITSDIMRTLVACGQKNVTLAVEAGSERLRKVINKNLTKQQILNAVKIAKEAGLKGFKFYGMLGLPTETKEDIDEMILLAKELKSAYKGFDISFGFSTFVPKPNTPFQWIGREDNKSLEQKSNYIKKEMHKIGVHATVSSAKWDYWQAVLSRGDSRLADLLEEVYKTGGKLGAYKKAAVKFNIDTDEIAHGNWSFDSQLPWDFIELNPGKEFLIKENQRLLNDNHLL